VDARGHESRELKSADVVTHLTDELWFAVRKRPGRYTKWAMIRADSVKNSE